MPITESFSGIRGMYDDGLDEQVALRYTFSYLTLLKNKFKNKKLKIVIGTDTRPSKDIIKNAAIEALDCEIIDLGIASTPMVEFGVRHFKADGGIIITASHNEPYWNGFKFLDNDGAVLRPEDMEKVIKFYSKIRSLPNEKFFNSHLYKNKNPKKITIKKIQKKYQEINDAYTYYILKFLSEKDKNKIKNSNLKVLIDPNGGTGTIAKPVLENLNVRVHGINMEHGVFNRIVEPNEDSLIYLINEVRDKGYDFAAGFDCDADRVEIVTSKCMVSGNQILALIADEILKNARNKVIAVNDATSSVVRDTAKRHKAKYLETQVGEINVVDKIYKLKAPIGGEGSSSGVIIPPSRCRDGILTLVYLLKIIANNKKNLDDLIKSLPSYFNIKKKADIGKKSVDNIKKALKVHYKGNKITDNNFGSLKIFLDSDSFIWIRASKTEPGVLRVISDAPSKEQAEKIMDEALNLLKK
jgi:phosphomannomutase